MSRSSLIDEDSALEWAMMETFMADRNNEYPKSASDLQGCLRNLMVMFKIERRPMPVKLRYKCDTCKSVGEFIKIDERGQKITMTCDQCKGKRYVTV